MYSHLFRGGYIHVYLCRLSIFVCFDTCLFVLFVAYLTTLAAYVYLSHMSLFPACIFVCVSMCCTLALVLPALAADWCVCVSVLFAVYMNMLAGYFLSFTYMFMSIVALLAPCHQSSKRRVRFRKTCNPMHAIKKHMFSKYMLRMWKTSVSPNNTANTNIKCTNVWLKL